MKKFYVSVIVLCALNVTAQTKKKNLTTEEQLDSVTVSTKRNVYKIDSSASVAKLPLKDLENPQVYNTISKILLKDQVITNLNNALKNATGVTRLWESTGRGGDGAEFYSMRGFAVQPTLMNGMPSISNGIIDPVNIENIEVIKGPSGTLYGSSLISYGGLINVVTKKPYEKFGGELGFVAGSFGLNRFTADVNAPINNTTFLRVNAVYHDESSFQDAGYNKAFYIAPSLKLIANDKLTFFINTEFKSAEAANAPMLFLSRYMPLGFKSMDVFKQNYNKSYTNNSLSMKNPSFSLQGQALYTLSSQWTSQTVLSRSYTTSNGYYHYLYDIAGDGDHLNRYISKRAASTLATGIQQNFNGDFYIGKLRNRMVIGVDYLNTVVSNNSTGWVGNGTVSLFNQTDNGVLTQQGVDNLLVSSSEGNAAAETKTISAYVSDVINITPALAAMVSLRADNFTGKPLYASDEVKSQTTLSPKFGVTYQPIMNKLSLFANYMNGFINLSPVTVSDISGSNPTVKVFDPERANQWEAGFKANIYKDKIAITTSYYNIKVSNKTYTDPNNPNNTLQGGEVESKGFEFSVVTSPIEGLSIVAGFSKNDAKYTTEVQDGGYLGMRPEEAGPETVRNFLANYKIQKGKLKGLGFGFSAYSASSSNTLNRKTTGSFTLPGYTVMNALVSYTAEKYSLIFKLDNLANTEYFTGWSTVTAQKPRSVSLSIAFKL